MAPTYVGPDTIGCSPQYDPALNCRAFANFLFLNFLKKSKVCESSIDRTLLMLLPP